MDRMVKRWIIGICVGMCIPAAVYAVRSYMHRNDKYTTIAKAMGVDTDTWADINRLCERSASRDRLSSFEMAEDARWLSNKSRNVRLMALLALHNCSDPSLGPQVISLIKTRLDDDEPAIREKAIIDLKKANDPDLAADVGRLSNDRVDYVRDTVKEVLAGASPGGKSK